MADPSFRQWLAYGPAAPEVLQKINAEHRARAIAPLLAELKAATQAQQEHAGGAGAAPDATPGELNTMLPSPHFSAGDQVELSSALAKMGLNEKDMAAAQREQELMRAAHSLDTPAQQVDALNNKSVAPVHMSGGVAYDTYDQNKPIRAESPAQAALARTRQAQASNREMRNAALSRVLDDSSTAPLVGADIANSNTVSHPKRVKVRLKNGTSAYMDAVPRPDGGYDYRPSVDQGGGQLRVPPSSPGALEKDAQFLHDSLGIPMKEATNRAYDMRRFLKTDRPEESWSKLTKYVSGMRYGAYARDPKRLYEKTAELWHVMMPDVPIPRQATLDAQYGGQGDQGDQGQPPTPAPSSGAQAARQAGAGGADSVRLPGSQRQNQDQGHEEARRRAIAEGYNNLGSWIEGKGFEVYDDNGKLIGYYN